MAANMEWEPHQAVLVVGAMRQRILGSHTLLCHRRMVITTLFSVFFSLHCSADQFWWWGGGGGGAGDGRCGGIGFL